MIGVISEPDPEELAALSSNFIDAGITSSTQDTGHNLPLTGSLGASLLRDQHLPLRQPGSQHQVVNTAYRGYDNGWSNSGFTAPLAWQPFPQEFAQSGNLVTPDFSQSFDPALGLFDYPSVLPNAAATGQPDLFGAFNDFGAVPNTIANGQLDPMLLQLPISGVTDGFGVVPNAIAIAQSGPTPLDLLDVGVDENFGSLVVNEFTDYNSSAQWDDFAPIESQPTLPSFYQLPIPTTTGIPAALALPVDAANRLTARAVRHPAASALASRHLNDDTHLYICDHPGCQGQFRRPGDLRRHKQKHGIPDLPCPVPGCDRRGPKAFYRADKLRDHQRKKHRMAI